MDFVHREESFQALLLEDSAIPQAVLNLLAREGFVVHRATSVGAAAEEMAKTDFDVILAELTTRDRSLLDTLWKLSRVATQLPLVVRIDPSNENLALEAVKMGAQDVLLKGRHDNDALIRALLFAIERKRIESAIRVSQERYSLAVRGANDGLWDWDLGKNRVFLSARWLAMVGGAEKDRIVPSQTWFDRVHPEHREGFAAAVKAHIDGETPHLEHEYLLLDDDGSYRWMLCRGLAVRDETGRAYRLAGSQTDTTSRKEAEERLVYTALHDSLTGLPNRTLFLQRLEEAIARTQKDKSYRFSVLFLDLDRFKVVNDSLGHEAGDLLLIETARRVSEILGPDDTVARLGGDEFAVLLGKVDCLVDAKATAGKINAVLKTPVTILKRQVYTSASIGIVCCKDQSETPENLLRDADAAMYRAKSSGRARYAVFDEGLHHSAVEQLGLETDLRNALERGEFLLHYQPIVSLKSGSPVRFEALLRWQSPTRGLMGPSSFMPLLEETGLIIPVGEWVLRSACRQLASLRAQVGAGGELMALCVNVSGIQFEQPNFVQVVESAIRDFLVPRSSLVLEVTETALMESADRAVKTLERLRELGVGIEIDDFGTGYSSLSYLQKFPIDGLKIDRSFVQGIGVERDENEIIRAVVSLAQSLKIGVVAEGIETAEQLRSLRTLDCDYGQGYLFSRPLPNFLLEVPVFVDEGQLAVK